MAEDDKQTHAQASDDDVADALDETVVTGGTSRKSDDNKTMATRDEDRLPGSRVQTSMLNMPDDAAPMVDRAPQPNVPMLTEGWTVIFRMGEKKKVLPLDKKIMVGRAVENDGNNGDDDVTFDLTDYGAYHFGVSRHHATLTFNDGYLYLEDLGSTNGTRINGFQLTANQKYRLRDGDEIEFARLRSNITFKAPDNS